MKQSRAVRFDQDSVRDYEFTHGRKPKGVGVWSFSLVRDGSWTTVEERGSFASAKNAAMRTARELGCTEVTVNT